MNKPARIISAICSLAMLFGCSGGNTGSGTPPKSKRPTNQTSGNSSGSKTGAPLARFFESTAAIQSDVAAENERRLKVAFENYNKVPANDKLNYSDVNWREISKNAISNNDSGSQTFLQRIALIDDMQDKLRLYQICTAANNCTAQQQTDLIEALHELDSSISGLPQGQALYNSFATEKKILQALILTPVNYVGNVAIGDASRVVANTKTSLANKEASATYDAEIKQAFQTQSIPETTADMTYAKNALAQGQIHITDLKNAIETFKRDLATYEDQINRIIPGQQAIVDNKQNTYNNMLQEYKDYVDRYVTCSQAGTCTTEYNEMISRQNNLFGQNGNVSNPDPGSAAHALNEAKDLLASLIEDAYGTGGSATNITGGRAGNVITRANDICTAESGTTCDSGIPDAAFKNKYDHISKILTAISPITPVTPGVQSKKITYLYDEANGSYQIKFVDENPNRTEPDPENPGQTRSKTIVLKAGDLKSVGGNYYQAVVAGDAQVSNVAPDDDTRTYLPKLKAWMYNATELEVPAKLAHVKNTLNRLLNNPASATQADIDFFNKYIGDGGLFGVQKVKATYTDATTCPTPPNGCVPGPAKVAFAEDGTSTGITQTQIIDRLRTLVLGSILNSTLPIFDIQQKATSTDTIKLGGNGNGLKLKYADFGIWTVNTKTQYIGGQGNKLLKDNPNGIADGLKETDVFDDTPFYSGIEALKQPFSKDLTIGGGSTIRFTGNVLAVATKQANPTYVGSGSNADVRKELFGLASLDIANDTSIASLALKFAGWYDFTFSGIDVSKNGFQSPASAANANLKIEKSEPNKPISNGIEFASLNSGTVTGSADGQLYGVEQGRPTEGVGIFQVGTSTPGDVFGNSPSCLDTSCKWKGIELQGAWGVAKKK